MMDISISRGGQQHVIYQPRQQSRPSTALQHKPLPPSPPSLRLSSTSRKRVQLVSSAESSFSFNPVITERLRAQTEAQTHLSPSSQSRPVSASAPSRSSLFRSSVASPSSHLVPRLSVEPDQVVHCVFQSNQHLLSRQDVQHLLSRLGISVDDSVLDVMMSMAGAQGREEKVSREAFRQMIGREWEETHRHE